jgi:hypothetical protein
MTTSFIPRRAKLAQYSLHRQPARRRYASDRRSITAPGPLFRHLDHARPDQARNDVPPQLKQIGVPLDENALEPPLDQVPGAAMASVRCLCVDPIQMPHPLGKIPLDRLRHQMVVIRH